MSDGAGSAVSRGAGSAASRGAGSAVSRGAGSAVSRGAGSAASRRSRRSRGDGYLMVEALCTLALSATVLMGLAAVLSLTVPAAERTARRVGDQEVAHHLLAALRQEIGGMARARWAGDPPRFVFDGLPDRMLFAADVVGADGIDRTDLVAIQAERFPAGTRLLRATAPLRPGARAVGDIRLGRTEQVYRGSMTVRFGYRGHPAPEQPQVIAEAWPSGAALPSAVLLYVADPAWGGAEQVLTIALRVDADIGCAARQDAFCSLRAPADDGETDEADPRDDP